MPHMIAYLGGDSDTLAVRRANREDARIVVEFPDHDRMLVVMVTHKGEICMAWSEVRGAKPVRDIEYVGQITGIDTDQDLDIEWFTEPVWRELATPVVEFSHLQVVPDEEGDPDYE